MNEYQLTPQELSDLQNYQAQLELAAGNVKEAARAVEQAAQNYRDLDALAHAYLSGMEPRVRAEMGLPPAQPGIEDLELDIVRGTIRVKNPLP